MTINIQGHTVLGLSCFVKTQFSLSGHVRRTASSFATHEYFFGGQQKHAE